MGRAWAPVLGRPSEKSLAEPSRCLAGKSVVTFEVDQPALGDDGDDEAPEAKRSLFCPRPGSSPRRRELDATSRNDLLNAFAKFSPAGVHAELTDLGGSESSFRAMSRKFMQKTFTEPSARSTRGALLFVDISGFTRLSTSLGIEALKRHINAIYTRAVDIIVKHGGDVLKFAGDAMLITWLAASDGDVALNGAAPRRRTAPWRCRARDPRAEPCASAGQTSLSPEVWRRLARNGFSGAPSDLEPSVFLLHGRLRQSMTSLMFRGKSSSDVGAAPKRSGERSNSYRSPRGDAIAREIPDLIQLQHKARTSFRLRLRAHAEVLKCFTVPAVQEIYESLGSAGELQRERKDSSSRRAPEDHLAEQRQVTTVFINVVGLGDALMDGELDKVQDCFMTVQLCVRDRGGMLRQFIVDDKGVVAIAFFGVRGSSFEDNEYRAVRFTLAVVRALKRLDVDAYCGITVGKGFCGLVGALNRCEYAVMGPTVNLAARLMAAASKKQSEPIFVDERVSRAARQSQSTRHVFTAMEPIKAKGFAEPVKVFALAESERDRGRVTASAAHEAQVPFTGREKLLASIDGIVEAAAREDESASPQPDSPGAEPAVAEAAARDHGPVDAQAPSSTRATAAGARGPPTSSARSARGRGRARRGRRESAEAPPEDANPKPSPSRALSTKLRKASGALAGAGDDDKHSLSRFIRERMTKSQVAAYGDRLAFLDGDGMDSPEWTALNKSFAGDPRRGHRGARRPRRAATRRTLLLIDNGHWLDFPSWELLEELVTKKQSHVGPAQVVVVLTKRGGVKLSAPNVWDNLMATYTTTTLSLDPLGAAASCKLLCAALDIPGHSVTPGTVDNVLRKCAGIPVLILALVESIEKHVKQAEAGIEDTVLEGETLSSEMSEETLAVVKSALQKVPCFINLDDEAKFKHVASRMVRIDCAPGKTLITKGEKGSTIYVLESGAMECVVDGVKVSDVSAGDVIGERAMLTNSARTATVSAATDTVLWSLERRDARFLVKEADYVWRRVLALESLSIRRGDSSLMMPSSMAGIITNRLDTLSLNATTVVKLASAFGPVFHEEALRTCFPGPKRSKSADAIAELVAAALIQPQDPPLGNETLLKPSLPNQRRSWAVDSASPKASDAPGEDEKERDECDSENGAASSSGLYRFKNQQIAEVIYSVVLDEQKREYHRRIAEFFEDCLALVEGTRTTHTRPETKPALLSVITALHLGRSDLHLLLADHYTRSKSNEDKAMAYKGRAKTALSPKEIKITESARLQSYIELAELYARFEMEPRPREDAEASPLGESSIALLSHALAILGVDHEALGEDGFASLLASNDREEHLSQSEKKLLARALSQLGWCHVRAGTALDHQFALQLTESCFAHSIRLSKVAGDKLAAADALNGFGTFYQLRAPGRRAAVDARRAGELLFKRLTHSAPRKGADHDDEPPPRAPGDGKKSANRYKRTNTDATPENLKPPTPPGEHRSLLRFSRLLLLSRPDLWSIAEDKLMESYDIRESSCVEGKPSLDVAQVCVTLGSLQMDMSKIDAARAYYALALHMYESELGPLHPRTAHALAGLARIARNQGTKLITDPTPTTRRAGALILDEAIDYQARAVKARSALGQRHGTYQASAAELRAMELQRDALHLTEPAPRSADSPYQPGRAQRRKSL
ncbi:cGMP-dependent protein kinase [Aureococcus anophagefferens]|nr:cGMP-dependent protein kinase [Aureococcus anophagefferens]